MFLRLADESKKVGKIVREWSSIVQLVKTDADSFSADFPIDLDVNIKATILGAMFLIDSLFI